MSRIAQNIDTLEKHMRCMSIDPERYRPSCCPHCGHQMVWFHGQYTRLADRESGSSSPFNLVPIPRFICAEDDCRKTCSRLPQCIPPRRWYLWCVQQRALLTLLCGSSLKALAQSMMPARSTLKRWREWLILRNRDFQLYLAAHLPQLHRTAGWMEYWRDGFTAVGLSSMMAILDRTGVSVP